MTYELKVKRIYVPAEPADGYRVLADRLWPRGIKKEKAGIDVWAKDLAPSTELRKSFAHQAERFEAFREAYLKELDENPEAAEFSRSCAEVLLTRNVTLLYAAKEETCNNAAVLREWLQKTVDK